MSTFTPGPIVDEIATRDRKSTRLNSSHGYISYAVFCLKKKMIDVAEVAYGYLSVDQLAERRSARVGLHQGGPAPANLQLDGSAGLTRVAETGLSMRSLS